VALALLEHETLDGAQVKLLLEGGELPPRRSAVPVPKPETVATPPETVGSGPVEVEMKPKLA
jgi:hypothetical protein